MSISVLWLTTRNTVLRDGLLFVLASDCILFCIDLLWAFRFFLFYSFCFSISFCFVLTWFASDEADPEKKTAFLWWLSYDWWCAWLIIRSVCVCFFVFISFSLLSSCCLFSSPLFLLYSTLRATGKTWYSLYRSVWDMALFCHIPFGQLDLTDYQSVLCCLLPTCGQRGKIMMTDWLMMFILWTPVYGPVHSFEYISFVHVIYMIYFDFDIWDSQYSSYKIYLFTSIFFVTGIDQILLLLVS